MEMSTFEETLEDKQNGEIMARGTKTVAVSHSHFFLKIQWRNEVTEEVDIQNF